MSRTGAFAALQPRYALHGIATYPLGEDKTPAISHYDRVGKPGSAQLALKFSETNAFGFCAGARNKVTVIDIDISDDRLAAEILKRYGPTPLRVRTPSGGRHFYYRHNGEKRRIRPMPHVDVLGDGNVVAAGSIVPRGRYHIEQGDLDDLARLPAMIPDDAAPNSRVPEGRRNHHMFEYCRRTVAHCNSLKQLIDAATGWVENNVDGALSVAEVRKTCASVWNYRGGRKGIMTGRIIEPEKYKALIADPEALCLFAYLAAENGRDAEFMIADGLGTARGWPRRFVPKARRALLGLGLVERVRAPADGVAAMYRWGPQTHVSDLPDSVDYPVVTSPPALGPASQQRPDPAAAPGDDHRPAEIGRSAP